MKNDGPKTYGPTFWAGPPRSSIYRSIIFGRPRRSGVRQPTEADLLLSLVALGVVADDGLDDPLDALPVGETA